MFVTRLAAEEIEWRDMAACKGQGADRFYDNRGGGRRHQETLAMCRGCPVRVRCLDYCLKAQPSGDLDFGLWAGTSTADRKGFRRRGEKAKQGGAEGVKHWWSDEDLVRLLEQTDARRKLRVFREAA